MLSLTKKGLVSLYRKLGYKTCNNWTVAKFASKLKKLAEHTDDAKKKLKGNTKLTKRFAKIVKAIENGTKIDILDVENGKLLNKIDKDVKKSQKAIKDKKSGKKESKPKKPGVISTILDLITNQGPISKKAILAKLVKKFPDRDGESMGKTIGVQVPSRLNKDKNANIVKDDKGRYSIKGKKKSKK